MAAAGPPGGERYVALGDSYTSSPFTGRPAPGPLGCLRSDNGYPQQVGAALGAITTNVSCAGAMLRELSAPQRTDAGVNPPQLDALGPDTTVVTVGLGGNDLGFTEILRSCLTALPYGAPCRDRFAPDGGDDALAARLDDLDDRLAAGLEEIADRAPDARIVVVGYPSVLPLAGPGCFPVLPLAWGDLDYLRGVADGLDAAMRSAAEDAGALYAGTAVPSAGHDGCEAPGVRWIEGVLPLAPAAPFHPNALGARATARAVLEALGAPVPVD